MKKTYATLRFDELLGIQKHVSKDIQKLIDGSGFAGLSRPAPSSGSRLDGILSELDISRVDFLKLDAEGAELSVLYAAMKLLEWPPGRRCSWTCETFAPNHGLCGAGESAIADSHGLPVVRHCRKGCCCRFPATWIRTTRTWSRFRSSAPKNF